MKVQTKINQIEKQYDRALSAGRFERTQTLEAQSLFLRVQLKLGNEVLTEEMQNHLDWQSRTNGAA